MSNNEQAEPIDLNKFASEILGLTQEQAVQAMENYKSFLENSNRSGRPKKIEPLVSEFFAAKTDQEKIAIIKKASEQLSRASFFKFQKQILGKFEEILTEEPTDIDVQEL